MNWEEFERRMIALERKNARPEELLAEADLFENDLQEKCSFMERMELFNKWQRTHGFWRTEG